MSTREANVGLLFVIAGMAAITLAVLLFGVTTESGAPDWVSIITAVAGVLVAGDGLFILYRMRRARGTGHHPAS
jgi:hypothetical protein